MIKSYHCSRCGATGHNARNGSCPRRDRRIGYLSRRKKPERVFRSIEEVDRAYFPNVDTRSRAEKLEGLPIFLKSIVNGKLVEVRLEKPWTAESIATLRRQLEIAEQGFRDNHQLPLPLGAR